MSSRSGNRNTEDPFHPMDVSEPAAGDDLAASDRERVIAIVKRLEENQAALACGRHHLLGFGRVGGKGLLA